MNQFFFNSANASEQQQLVGSIEGLGAKPVAPESNIVAQIAPIALIFIIFYFLLIRPQSNALKKQRVMIDALKKSDKIVTNSGILGIIKGFEKDNSIAIIEISEGVEIKIFKNSIKEKIE